MHRPPFEAPPSRAGRAFFGRSEELAILRGIAAQVRTGERATVSVEGAPGCGKTALLQYFAASLDDFTVLRAICDPAEQYMSLGVISQLLGNVPGHLLSRYPLLDDLSVAPASRLQATVFNVGLQLACLLDELTSIRPVALVIDDALWADWRSLRPLRIALDRMQDSAVLFVAALNTVGIPGSAGITDQLFKGLGHRTRLTLPGLDAPAVTEIARAFVPGHEWSKGALDKLWRRTEGNPLYVQSVLAHADTAGSDDMHWVTRMPESLCAVVRSRLSTFDSDARRLVEALAVFDSAVAVEVAGQVASVLHPEQALRQPVDQGLVVQTIHDGVLTASIPHRIQRDAVYVALSPTRRRDLHRAAATAVTGPARWMHRVAAADSTDMAQVASGLESAAERWLTDGDVDLAATLLLWAAELSDTRESREGRLLTAVVHLLSARRTDRAVPLLRPTADCTPSPLRDCALGMAAAWQGDRATAERLLTGVIGATRNHAGLEWVAREAGGVLASLYVWHGLGVTALHTQQSAMAIGHHASHLASEAEGNLLSARLLRDGPAAVVAHLDRLPPDRTDQPADGPVQADGYFLSWASICRILVGQLEAGRDSALKALSIEKQGRTSAFTGDIAHYSLAAAHYWMGRWEEADDAARRAISLAVAFEHPWACVRSYALAAFVAGSRGEWDRAAELISESEACLGRSGPPQYVLFPSMARAVLAQAQGDHPAVLRALSPMLELPAANAAWREVYAPWWLPLRIEALISCSDLREAEAGLNRLSTDAGEDPPAVVFWLKGRLCEARGDLSGATHQYRTAIANPSSSDEVPLQRARAEQDYARVHALVGDDTRAIEHLRQAYRGFEALGARPYLASCRELLTAALRG